MTMSNHCPRNLLLLVGCWLIRSTSSYLCSSTTSLSSSRMSRSSLFMSTAAISTSVPSWADLTSQVATTPVGQALNNEVELRKNGKGSAHVQNTLRKFDSDEDPKIILYRDHAGW